MPLAHLGLWTRFLGFISKTISVGDLASAVGALFARYKKKKTHTKKRIKNNVLDPGLGCYHCTMVTSRPACKKICYLLLREKAEYKDKAKTIFPKALFLDYSLKICGQT